MLRKTREDLKDFIDLASRMYGSAAGSWADLAGGGCPKRHALRLLRWLRFLRRHPPEGHTDRSDDATWLRKCRLSRCVAYDA